MPAGRMDPMRSPSPQEGWFALHNFKPLLSEVLKKKKEFKNAFRDEGAEMGNAIVSFSAQQDK